MLLYNLCQATRISLRGEKERRREAFLWEQSSIDARSDSCSQIRLGGCFCLLFSAMTTMCKVKCVGIHTIKCKVILTVPLSLILLNQQAIFGAFQTAQSRDSSWGKSHLHIQLKKCIFIYFQLLSAKSVFCCEMGENVWMLCYMLICLGHSVVHERKDNKPQAAFYLLF